MFFRHLFWPTLLIGAVLALLFSGNAQAQPSWTESNLAIVDQHIIPRYTELTKSAQALSEQAQTFCQKPDQASLSSLRQSYHRMMDDWMGIQHLQSGPIGMFLRYNRYQFWPDKHGTGTKQLRRLLAKQDMQTLAQERFARGSVSIQGATALERLLFPTQLKLAEFATGKTPSYQCGLTKAIADNLAQIAQAVFNDWQSGKTPYRDVVATANKGNAYYNSAKDVSGTLLNDLHTQLQSIIDLKLLRPMERYRMKRAESWRSRRSLRNIEINLQACKELYQIGFAPHVTDRQLQQKITQAFDQSIAAAQNIKIALYAIQQNSPEAKQLDDLLAETKKLKRLIAAELPDAIDLVLGFNSLDGD